MEFDSLPDKSPKLEIPTNSSSSKRRSSISCSHKSELSSFSRLAAPSTTESVKNFTIQRIKARVNKVLDSERERHCCCVFQKLMRHELSTNNQIYNLLTKTSPLNRRAVRLTLCYFALVVELATCAFFFNLSPNSPNVPLFWDRMSENFWVAVYSTLFLMLPLLAISCLFSFPSK